MQRTSVAIVVSTLVLTVAAVSMARESEPTAQPAAQSEAGRVRAGKTIEWSGGASQTAFKSPAEVTSALASLVSGDQPQHFVVQFDRPLSATERVSAGLAGVQLLDYLGNDAYFAAARAPELDGVAFARLPVIDVRAIERAWKLHPMLERDEVPQWAVTDSKADADPVVGTYVVFHQDVALAEGVALARVYGATVRDAVESVNALVVELPFSLVKPLALEDAVQYIEPPLPRMDVVTLNDSNRAILGADTLQGAPYGLDGTGVSVMVYDAGTALGTHNDFGGRATVRDGSGTHYHATHVAGTIGGDGASSGGQYTGMAPNATIESYGFEYDGSGTFLYTNPGDFEDDYAEAITVHGTAIANNSIGTNTESNGFDCDFQGNYGLMSSLIDAVVRGSASGGVPTRIVWAAGNERQGSRCDVEGYGDYYSTAPPACAKNHITVGALNSNDDSMTSFSSWGPTDDGRLKPDISGPGCQSNDDLGVTSLTSSGTSSYTTLCGTSMASPSVCGISTLLIQDYRLQYGGPDPRNSTLKAILAQTAFDGGNPGPDYQYGYGSVRAVDAVEFMRSGYFVEESISQGETQLFTVSVGGGDSELKVTLAWDDYPATPGITTALVNDLDLHVFSPMGTEVFPWTLDPSNPSANATQTQRDSLNNIEQVSVASPAVGVWRIEVRGNNVPQGPQPFSLTASPNLISCADQGIVSLDRGSYGCGGSAEVVVIDCGLNTDDGVVETVSVTVSSTSEPGGETLLLTETGPETAAFSASLPLGTVDGAGILLVAEGDTVQAEYVDADDGMGGMGVSVTANAGVDCTAPSVLGVSASGIEPQRATVDVTTDEPARATLVYGTSCGALTEQSVSLAANTVHAFQLSGLTHGTTYFYTVEVEDDAGNTTLADNGGGCYSFVTLDVPDYFTEEFGTHDLDFMSVTYEPNATFEAYTACARPRGSLPTDPAGGASLPLSDDDNEVVTVGGGHTVSLYGVDYGSFYVGSNGYITFTAGDTDYTESLSDHFDLPRISANFDDYNPSSAGTVSWKQLGNRIAVTWLNVPEYSQSNQNTFQVELFFDGRIRITYGAVASVDGISGLSAGGGVPDPFIESDLSEYDCADVDGYKHVPRGR